MVKAPRPGMSFEDVVRHVLKAKPFGEEEEEGQRNSKELSVAGLNDLGLQKGPVTLRFRDACSAMQADFAAARPTSVARGARASVRLEASIALHASRKRWQTYTATVSAAVRPPPRLPETVASSSDAPSLKTLSVASETRDRFATLCS